MDKLELVSRERVEEDFAAALAAGRLPDHFLYVGEGGADKWLALAASSDFDIAARLEGLLRGSLPELAPRLSGARDVVSLGAGAGRKERLILEALAERGMRPSYFPIDISTRLIDLALAEVRSLAPEGCGLVAPIEALPRLARCFHPPVLYCCLGNNACNYEPEWLLPLLRAQLKPADRLLLDLHVVPEDSDTARWETTRRYGCRLNRDFNLGPLLERGLPGDACELSLEVVASEGLGWRTRKEIRLTREATLSCAGKDVQLAAGTTLQMGFTYKYTAPSALGLLISHGLAPQARFSSEGGDFLLLLLAPTRRATRQH